MAKGFFSQVACVLFSTPPSLDEIAALLPGESRRDQAAAGAESAGGDCGGQVPLGPSLVLPFRPDKNGTIAVDLLGRAWPDSMGDPRGEAALFTAWTMGHYGPFTFPGGLARALEQNWLWRGARERVPLHAAFARVRLSYVLGAAGTAAAGGVVGGTDGAGTGVAAAVQLVPKDCDPVAELRAVTDVCHKLLAHPKAMAYFNPNGEVVADPQTFNATLEHDLANGLLPVDLWCNLRMFNFGQDRKLMDTVGMAQLDVSDIEAIFPRGEKPTPMVAGFLRQQSVEMVEKGHSIQDGDTVTDPDGQPWIARRRDQGAAPPPRPLLRLEPAPVM